MQTILVMHSRTIAPLPLTLRCRFHFLRFFCLFEKYSRSLVRFSSEFQESFVMVSFIPDCMSDIFSSNNNACFEHPALSATLFRMVRVEK